MNFVVRPQFAFAGGLVSTLLVSTGWLCGCSGPAKKEVLTAETSNLKPLSILYGQYQSKNENRAPANEADFKKFIEAQGKSILEQHNVSIDGLFVSSRDAQPYTIIYRGDPTLPSGVIAYEREGEDGKRVVAYPYGAVALADEIRFRELVPDAQ